MKICDAKPIYYQNRKELVDQIRDIAKRKEEAEKQFRITGDTAFSEEAATLELSLDATNKAFEENQKVLDNLVETSVAIQNMETAKQQGDIMAEEAKNLGKIMTVFRRLAHGDIVPQSDEKKLMEYDSKMYTAAKNMQAMAQRMKDEIKKHKSLWEDEEKKEYPDAEEIAENSEYPGELPDIEIPDSGTANAGGMEGGSEE